MAAHVGEARGVDRTDRVGHSAAKTVFMTELFRLVRAGEAEQEVVGILIEHGGNRVIEILVRPARHELPGVVAVSQGRFVGDPEQVEVPMLVQRDVVRRGLARIGFEARFEQTAR